MRTVISCVSALWLLVFSSSMVSASEMAPPIQWVKQFGSPVADRGQGVAVDKQGDIYLAFYTSGSIDGYTGGSNIFLRKYDSAGNVLWTEPMGSSSFDLPIKIEINNVGDVYVAGYWGGNGGDTFLSKISSSGTPYWYKRFGTSSREFTYDMCIDGQGNIIVSGMTEGAIFGTNAGESDLYVAKFDSDGNELWSRQRGTNGHDFGKGVAVDVDGNIYVAGHSNFGYPITDIDSLVVKYDSEGELLWTKEINPSNGYVAAKDIAVVGDTVYVIGDDKTGPGSWDAFLAALDTDGHSRSYFRWGTPNDGLVYDLASSMVVVPSGGLLVTGNTRGDLAAPVQGSQDAFLTKFDADGVLSWTKQFGATGTDYANAVSIDDAGNIFIAGHTTGSLGGPSAGYFDAYLAKLSYIPEPGTGILAVAAFVVFSVTRRQGIDV